MQARSNVFENGRGGGGSHLKSSKKTSSHILKILIGGGGGEYYFLQLRFYCDFPDFHLSFYLLQKGREGNSNIFQFIICEIKRMFDARKSWDPPPRPPTQCNVSGFFVCVHVFKKSELCSSCCRIFLV